MIKGSYAIFVHVGKLDGWFKDGIDLFVLSCSIQQVKLLHDFVRNQPVFIVPSTMYNLVPKYPIKHIE